MIPRRAHNFGTYFVSSQTWERRDLFKNDELAEPLIRRLFHYGDAGKYLLHDFVIRPEEYRWISIRPEYKMDEVPRRLKPSDVVAEVRHG